MIVNNDATVSPCCVSDEFYRAPDGRAFMMDRDGIMAVWQSQHMDDVRAALASGQRHSACDNCWSLEDRGLDSHRMKQLRQAPARSAQRINWDDPVATNTPAYVSLRLGNTCNLKCRICGPGASTKWIEESNATTGGDWVWDQQLRLASMGNGVERRRLHRWAEDNTSFWTELEALLPDISEISFGGGEPFMIPQQAETLRRLAKLDRASGIDLHYNTNGTGIPLAILSDVLPRFRSVAIQFSVDGTGAQFEYQRHGADWSEVDGTMRRCLEIWNTPQGPRGSLGVTLTVSSMNMWYLPDYADHFNTIGMPVGLNIVVGRPELDPANLPDVVRRTMLRYLESVPVARMRCCTLGTPWSDILDLLRDEPRMESCQPFVDSMRRMDAYRGEDYGKVFPEMARLVGYRAP